jgi:hypothetical protein
MRHLVSLSRAHSQPVPAAKHRTFSGSDATRNDKQRHEKSRKQLNSGSEKEDNSLKGSDKTGKNRFDPDQTTVKTESIDHQQPK